MSNRYLTPEIQQAIYYQMLNTPYKHYPTAHSHTRDIFPAVFYDKILENLPSDDEYTGIYALGRVSNPENKPETRLVFSLRDDLDKLDGEKCQFWQEMSDFFLGTEFAMQIVQRAAPIAASWRGNDFLNRYSLLPVAELFRDLESYQIGPHTDIQSRLLNCFFYLPEDDARAHLGTSFYVPNGNNPNINPEQHNRFEDFTRVYTAPYVRNSMASFVRTPSSYHGVEPLQESGYRRNVLAYFIRLIEKK